MRYDVFISYSHAGDDLLSERVQAGLQRFAKPWWRRRALNVFRDRTGLSANPGLWSSIADALDNSRYFLMLASPDAASSPWCEREVAQWRAKHGSQGLLVLLTDGELVWDDDANDFDWSATTALGAGAFAGCFAEEPLYVDMRWARSEVQLDLTDGRFRDQIAELAAPVHGMAKDELAGADVRQHRRTLRQAFAAGVALVLLTIASIATSAYALNAKGAAQRSEARARTEQKRADDQATIASRESQAAKKARSLADQRRKDADRQRKLADRQRKLAVARQREALLSASEADRQRGLADARARDVAASNGKLVLVNGQLVDQEHLTESQRAAAVASAIEADRQRKLALARALEAQRSKKEADRQRAAALSNAAKAELSRLAGVARALDFGSEALLANRVTDGALLLAAQATKFAARVNRAGDPRITVGDDALRPALVDALQRNPRQIGQLRGLDGPIADVAVAPDNSRAAAVSLDGHAAAWHLPDGQLLSTFTVPTDTNRIRFGDSNTVVVAGAHRIDAYRTPDAGATWTHTWRWNAPNPTAAFSGITAIATTPTRVLIARYDGEKYVVNLLDATGAPLGSAEVTDAVERIAFASSGTTFATAGLGTDPADTTGQTPRIFVHVFAAPATETAAFGVDPKLQGDIFPGVAGVGFSTDGHQLTVLLRGTDVPLYRWDIATHHEIPLGGFFGWSAVVPGTPIGLSNNLNAIVQRDNTDQNLAGVGHISTGTFTGRLDAPVAPPSTDFFYHGPNADPLQPPAFTPDGQSFLMAAGDGIIPIFELTDVAHSHYARTSSFVPIPGFSCNSTISPDGRILAFLGYTDTTATLRFTALDGSHAPINVSLSQPPQCTSLLGRTVAFGARADDFAIANTNGSVDVYDTTTGTRRLHFKPNGICTSNIPFQAGCGAQLAFSGSADNGRIAESLGNGELWTWDLHSGAVVASHVVRFAGPSDTFVLLVRLSESGSRLAVTSVSQANSQATIHALDATTHGWSQRSSFPIPASLSTAEALSPDGTRLAVADGAHLTMHDLDRGLVTWTTNADDLGAWFGPDGTLYTASATGAIRARSAENGAIRYTLDPTTGGPFSASPEALVVAGSHVLTAGTEYTFNGPSITTREVVTDWPLATTDLAAAACKEAGRNLTAAEWKQYVGDFDAYEKTCPNLP